MDVRGGHKESWAPKNWSFELWCWRRFLRVSWTARRSNQSILKEISPEYSLERLVLKLKLQYSGHPLQRVRHDWVTELNWIFSQSLKLLGQVADTTAQSLHCRPSAQGSGQTRGPRVSLWGGEWVTTLSQPCIHHAQQALGAAGVPRWRGGARRT